MRRSEGLLKSLWLNAQRYLRRVPHCLFRSCDPAEEALSELGDWQPDAIIAHMWKWEVHERLQVFGCPLVNTSGIVDGLPVPTVGPDNRAIGRMAAEHLQARGYRHFAFVGLLGLGYSQQRLAGFRQSLAGEGHAVMVFGGAIQHLSTILTGAPLEANRPALDWLDSLPPNTGIFVDDDRIGLALCDLAKAAGIDLLQRFAIITGHDRDVPSVPALSGVQVPEDRWGYEAARLAVQLARGEASPDPESSVLLQPLGVTERESTQRIAATDAYLREALEFIRAHANRQITVEDVAEAVSLGRRALERRFRAELNRTILEEIHRAHVEHARMLLVETDLPMPAVAGESGLTDEKHLRRLFVRQFGQTPGSYRRLFRIC